MTDTDKLAVIREIIGNDDTATDVRISVYLSIAKDAILHRMYPVTIPEDAVMPCKYDMLHCRLAARMFLRRGAEGEAIHIENGVHRDYESTNDDDLLCEITPYAKVVR